MQVKTTKALKIRRYLILHRVNINFKKIKYILVLPFALLYVGTYADDQLSDNRTVTIPFNHPRAADPVFETFQVKCSNFEYVFELNIRQKKLMLHVKDGNGSLKTNDLSDSALANDWLNPRYLWRPVYLCFQVEQTTGLTLSLQGVDLKGGRNALQIVSAYSHIESNAQIRLYNPVSSELRENLFSY